MAQYDVNWTARLYSTSGTVAAGYCLVSVGGTSYLTATSANRTTYGRAVAISASAGDARTPIQVILSGRLTPALSGLAAGTASWVRVTSVGLLERCTPTTGDDIVGRALPDGSVQFNPGVWDSDNVAGGGSADFGKTVVAMADANQSITDTEARAGLVKTTGALTAARTLTIAAPATDANSYPTPILNTCTGASIVVSVGTGNTIEIEPGAKALVQITNSGVSILVDLPLDPRDFGCPWNGVDDDLPGLTTMLASIPATQERRVVVQLPKGHGYCSDNLRINRNVDFRGHGRSYIAQTEAFNGIRFPPMCGVIVDGAYTSTDAGRGDSAKLHGWTVESQMAIVADPVAGLGRARRYIDTARDVWGDLPATVILGTVVIATGSAGTGAQADYINEGACRGGVLVMFRCTTAGTKGSGEPASFATAGLAQLGTTITATAGTAVWTVESVPKDYANGTAYVVGQRVVIPGDPDHVFECTVAGTSLTGAANFAAWGLPTRLSSSFAAPAYREDFYDRSTLITAGSNGDVLPQATINVTDTTDFAASGTVQIWTGSAFEPVAYTGVTATTLTGCTGGTGTLSTGSAVGQGVKWKHIPSGGITVLATWVDIHDMTIAGAMGAAIWFQSSAGYSVSANGLAGGSNFWSVRDCIFDSCGSGLTTNGNNTNGGGSSHVQGIFLGGGRTDVDAAAYLNLTDPKWGTGAAQLKDRTQGTSTHHDHYLQFSAGMPFRNDLFGAAQPDGNYSRFDKMVHEVNYAPKYMYPAMVTMSTSPSADSDAIVLAGETSRNIRTEAPGVVDATKTISATYGPQNSSVATVFDFYHSDDTYKIGIGSTDDHTYAPAKWWSFGKANGAGFYDVQLMYFPRPNAGGLWPDGEALTCPMPMWIAQDSVWLGAAPNQNPRSIGFDSAAPAAGYYRIGSVVFNNAATVGQPIGWQCTVSGSPGTWVAMANL